MGLRLGGRRALLVAGTTPINYKLRVEFNTADAAPIANPYAGEVGSLDVVDTGNTMSVTGGELVPVAAVTGTSDPQFTGHDTFTRVVGRTQIVRFKRSSAFGANSQYHLVGWVTSLPLLTNVYGVAPNANAGKHTVSINNKFADLPLTYADDTYYTYGVTLRSSGFYLFVDGNLEWVETASNATPLYAGIASRAASGRYPFAAQHFHVVDFTGAFATDTLATLDVSSPVSAQDYTGVANGIFHLDVTAPGVLANQTELRFRVQDANNYWTAYFDSSGNFKIDSVASGTPTNRLTVSSAIVGAGVRRILIHTNGTKIDSYTLNGTNYTKNTQVDVSYLTSATGVKVQIGSGWTVSGLKAWERTSAVYTAQYSPFLA